MTTSVADLAPGTVLAGYVVESVAGRGGMGVVYRARQRRPDRVVALKVISPELGDDVGFRARFEREADIAASIEHPNVIPVYEAGEDRGLLFLAMRYIDGTDLRELLRSEGRIDPRRAAGLVAQVGDALDAAHASGLVHRDIKPGNILLSRAGAREHVYLTDFGLTKRADSSPGLTKPGTWVGTLDYIAPEQIEGRTVDGRADIYSLGCVLFQLLSGHVPFERDTDVSKLYAHMSEPPPLLSAIAPDVPAGLEQVVQTAMAKDPAARYASAGDLGRAALAAAAQAPAPATRRGVAAADPPTVATPVPPQSWPAPPATAGQAGAWPPPQPPVSPPPAGVPPTYGGAPPAATQPRAPQAGPRGVLLAAAIGLGALVAIAAVVLLLGSGGGGNRAGHIAGNPIPVGKDPEGGADGFRSIWIGNAGDGTVSRINPRTNSATTIKIGGQPNDVEVGNGGVWAYNYRNSVTRIDPASNAVAAPLDVGPLDYFAAGFGSIWTVTSRGGVVSREDAQSGSKTASINLGSKDVQAITVGDGSVWVADAQHHTLVKIDPGTNKVADTIKLSGGAFGVSIEAGTAYVGIGNGLARVDTTSDTVGEPIPLVGADTYALGPKAVWLTFPVDNQVKRISLDNRKIIGRPIDGVGRGSTGIVWGERSAWVLNKSGTVVRIKPGS